MVAQVHFRLLHNIYFSFRMSIIYTVIRCTLTTHITHTHQTYSTSILSLNHNKSVHLANSRAITPKCLMGSGWLLNLAKIFCQQTFSQSLMIIQWKLLKLLSAQMLWTRPARRTCSHNMSRFFQRAYENELLKFHLFLL